MITFCTGSIVIVQDHKNARKMPWAQNSTIPGTIFYKIALSSDLSKIVVLDKFPKLLYWFLLMAIVG